MKVLISSKSESDDNLRDYHSNGNSLYEMLKTTTQNVKKTVNIEKEDNYIKTFNKSISKTLKNKKYYQD